MSQPTAAPPTPIATLTSAPEDITIQAAGLELGARVWGAVGGRPTLALHGWLDNAASFDNLAPLLPGHRIVCLDHPGHGHSQHLGPGGTYHFVDYVVAAIAAADALGWPTFALLGHSMGAAVALLVAGTVPERVTRASLIEGLGPLSTPPSQTPGQLAIAVQRAASLLGSKPRVYRDADEALARFARARHGLSTAAAEPLFGRAIETVEDGVRFRHDPRLRAPSRLRLTEEQVLAFMDSITCPVQLIAASKGWPYDAATMQRRRDALRDLRWVTVEGHHHLHVDDAATVAGHVQPFLAPRPASEVVNVVRVE